MLLEIIGIVVFWVLCYLAVMFLGIGFLSITPTLRQMQYERLLSPLNAWGQDTRVDNGFIRFENDAIVRFEGVRGSARRSVDTVFVNQLPGAIEHIRELCNPRPLSQAEIQRWQERIQHYENRCDDLTEQMQSEVSELELSQRAAKGEIKPTGKSVSVEEFIATINEHLEKE